MYNLQKLCTAFLCSFTMCFRVVYKVKQRTELQLCRSVRCCFYSGQYRIILSADTASEVRQMPSQKRR